MRIGVEGGMLQNRRRGGGGGREGEWSEEEEEGKKGEESEEYPGNGAEGACHHPIVSHNLETAETVTEAATDVPDNTYARRGSLRVCTNNRGKGRCAITGKRVGCYAADVLPRAPLAVKEPERSYFWVLVGILFGGALHSELWGLLGGPRCDDAGNGLYL